jgi:hypothetical protein
MPQVNDWALVQLNVDEWRRLKFQPLVTYKTRADGGEMLWSSTTRDEREVVLSFDWHVNENAILVRGQAQQANALISDATGFLSENQHHLHAAFTECELPWRPVVVRKHLLGFDGPLRMFAKTPARVPAGEHPLNAHPSQIF